MCGLVGIFGDPSVAMLKVFKNLLIVDQLRGTDSTGMFYVKQNYKWGIIKDVGVPNNILDSDEWREVLWKGTSDADNILLMGHNRAKTFGAVTAENAHPFKHGNIVMAHNGTLWDTNKLKVEKENFDVDSEHLCYSLNKRGIDETWMLLRGAAAITYYDMRTREFNLVRNDARPLFYAWSEGKKQLFWASETWMLRNILDRNKVKLEDSKVYTINPHFLHTFKWHPKTSTVSHSSRKLKEPVYKAPSHGSCTYVQNGVKHEWRWDDNHEDAYVFGYGNPHQSSLVDATGRSLPPSNAKIITDLRDARKKREYAAQAAEDAAELNAIMRLYKPKTAEEFRGMHLLCTLCNTPLSSDYRDSVLLDPVTGVCPSCFHDTENLVLSRVTVH